jgi:hypothetical protein
LFYWQEILSLLRRDFLDEIIIIKITRIRSWKLDQSGNKTNEEIMDSNEVIEGIN